MSANNPYSRDESDLKLENLFQRFQIDIARRDEQFMEEFRKIDASFRLMDRDISALRQENRQDIAWLTRLVMGILLLLLSIIVAAAIRWVVH